MTARRGVRLQRAGCEVAGRNCSSGESQGPVVETARRTDRDERAIARDGIESLNVVPPAGKGLPVRCVAPGASFSCDTSPTRCSTSSTLSTDSMSRTSMTLVFIVPLSYLHFHLRNRLAREQRRAGLGQPSAQRLWVWKAARRARDGPYGNRRREPPAQAQHRARPAQRSA